MKRAKYAIAAKIRSSSGRNKAAGSWSLNRSQASSRSRSQCPNSRRSRNKSGQQKVRSPGSEKINLSCRDRGGTIFLDKGENTIDAEKQDPHNTGRCGKQ